MSISPASIADAVEEAMTEERLLFPLRQNFKVHSVVGILELHCRRMPETGNAFHA
jgi:hypothetical protein